LTDEKQAREWTCPRNAPLNFEPGLALLRAPTMQSNLKESAAPFIDPLEFARGTLSALSFVATEAARETHVTRLQAQFERAGVAASMEAALGALHFLREAEPLDGGYWIPAPTRKVDLDGERCLLVGVHPTAELRRHFGSVQRAGMGRVVNAAEVVGLPKQSLAVWRGSDGSNASSWARTTIELAMQQLAPSIVSNGMESFGTTSGRGAAARQREPAWVRAGDSDTCTWQGVGLFRTRTSGTRYRYFLGRHEDKAAFLEGPQVRDSPRMQFGLAALASRALTIKMASSQLAESVSLPLSAPTSLRRLLAALCEADAQSFGRIWTCRDSQHLPVLQAALQELECETAS
jgi:hypothetical protein